MRAPDETHNDPETAASLNAIDAAIAGEPVAPQYAGMAELALLLAAERPELPAEVSRSLDQRLERCFADPARTRRGGRLGRLAKRQRGRVGSAAARRRRWGPARVATAGGMALIAAIVLAVVLVAPFGGSPAPSLLREPARALSGSAHPQSTPAAAAAGSSSPLAHPPGGGRAIVTSAQLALTTAPNRIESVARQVFGVVDAQNGIVEHSSVMATGAPDGNAQFQLSVPSSALFPTMAALSRLRYAAVASRTDATQDVTDQLAGVSHRLADAKALRTSLLKQLAGATTRQQINSVDAQIHDAEASIAGDEAAVRGLNHQADFSPISLSIDASGAASGGGGFTIGSALHDAGRVLVVAAGIALIVLAALVPLCLLAALAWWIALVLRRRRREQALDLA